MLAQSTAPSSGSLALAIPAPQPLSLLDERLSVGLPGILLARAPREIVEALLAHGARRARSAGRVAVAARAHQGAPLWQEVAARLLLRKLPSDPAKCADQIASAAHLRRAVVVARLPRAGSWDRAVAVELSALANAPLVLFVADGDEDASDLRAERFDVAPTLDDDGKRRWWSAIAEEAYERAAGDDLAQLESWWGGVKRVALAPEAPEGEELPEMGRALFTALGLAGRSWPVAQLSALGVTGEWSTGDALASLAGVGALQNVGGWVAVTPAWEARAAAAAHGAERGERATVAAALVAGLDVEPWAYARASELLAHAQADEAAIEAADRAHARALAAAEDPVARREIAARWMSVVEALPEAPRRELLVRTAERALAANEPEEATQCAHRAAASASGQDARVLLLLGRAAMARADSVSARVALEKARSVAAGDAEREATVGAELAELELLAGNIALSRELALAAVARSSLPETRIKGRNTLGKLLLAEAKWEEAERHFAEDALAAAGNSDTTSELRARINRGIALLSRGCVDEASGVFEGALAEGERRGEVRACGYALANLVHLASRRKEYGVALAYGERALNLLRSTRDRRAGADTLANLAALRLKLGLLDHAEHALSFGRRMGARAVRSGSIAAGIALARGRTLDAKREIDATILEATAEGQRDLLGEAHRLAARIALEDGDLPRMAEALSLAGEMLDHDVARAEVALLQSLYERAAGSGDVQPAKAALTLARAAGDDDLVREAHVLLAELFLAGGEQDLGREHVERAAALRDKIADGVPRDARAAFLALRDIAQIERLRAVVAEPSPGGRRREESAPANTAARPQPAPLQRAMIGDDPAIRGLLGAIRKVARSNSTVLIRGESGTGKELVAEALHKSSERSHAPLVTVNCAALVETLLLSELFGHEKGAFTGAFARRRGRFELAEGGTLFLDEIGDISPRTQVALLRVLQERTFERVGGTTAIRADVRIVCATHRDLRGMVDRGEFREDLYYRLRGITLEVPPLRHRIGDVPRIAEHLLGRIAAERGESPKVLSADALALLALHRWPGNVRELENALRAASLFAEGDVIARADLTENVDDLRAVAQSGAIAGGSLRPASPAPPAPPSSDSDASLADGEYAGGPENEAPLPPVEANATAVAYAQVRQGAVSLSDIKRQIERDCIARALAETKGNITRAAALLGMKRPRLSQLVKQYGLAAVSSEG